jgi:hypothetical protein
MELRPSPQRADGDLVCSHGVTSDLRVVDGLSPSGSELQRASSCVDITTIVAQHSGSPTQALESRTPGAAAKAGRIPVRPNLSILPHTRMD